MRVTLVFLILSAACFGQYAPEYVQSQTNPNLPITTLYYRDGSNNVQYVCKALSNQPSYSWTWGGLSGTGTISTISVSSNVATITFSSAHGLSSTNRIILGTATTASLSGTYVATVTSTTAVTIPTSGVADGSYTVITDPNLNINTIAPRTTASYWSVYQLFYTTTYVDKQSWANGTTSFTNSCGSKTTYSYN